MDARLRILVTLGALVLVTTSSFQRWWLLVAVAGGLALVWGRCGVGVRRFSLRCLVVLPVALGLSLLFCLSYGWQHGWIVAAEVVVRIILAVAVVYTLTATTPVPALLHGLAQMRVPTIFLATIAFMDRYLHVFREELQRMRRARECRAFGPNVFAAFRDLGWFLAILVLRAYERSERVYAAMSARCWDPSRGWPTPLPPGVYRSVQGAGGGDVSRINQSA